MDDERLSLTRRGFIGGSGAFGLISAKAAGQPAAVKPADVPAKAPAEPGPLIDRAFLRVSEGLIHYRSAGQREGAAPPLYMAHAGPGSSRGLAGLMGKLADSRFTIAPDMLGNGDSARPPAKIPTCCIMRNAPSGYWIA